jgi:hypothetical protein
MVKYWISIGLLIFCCPAQAEEVGPWFGSEVTSPEQVSGAVTTTNSSQPDQNSNCTIYSCFQLKKIAKPELKSASNP